MNPKTVNYQPLHGGSPGITMLQMLDAAIEESFFGPVPVRYEVTSGMYLENCGFASLPFSKKVKATELLISHFKTHMATYPVDEPPVYLISFLVFIEAIDKVRRFLNRAP
jgi:hypothetical protein